MRKVKAKKPLHISSNCILLKVKKCEREMQTKLKSSNSLLFGNRQAGGKDGMRCSPEGINHIPYVICKYLGVDYLHASRTREESRATATVQSELDLALNLTKITWA